MPIYEALFEYHDKKNITRDGVTWIYAENEDEARTLFDLLGFTKKFYISQVDDAQPRKHMIIFNELPQVCSERIRTHLSSTL